MATSDRAAWWVRRPPPWGLVDLPSGAAYLVVELFGLVLAINFVYAAVFLVLERKASIRPAVT